MDILSRSGYTILFAILIRLLAPLSFVALVVAVSYIQSAKEAGELVTYLSVVIVCSTIGRLGLDQLIIEKRTDKHSNSKALISSCIVVGFLLSAIAATLFYVIANYFKSIESFEQIDGTLLTLTCALASVAQLSSSFMQSRLRTGFATFLFPLLTYTIILLLQVLLNWQMQYSMLIGFASAAMLGLIAVIQANEFTLVGINFSVVRQSKYYAMNNIAALTNNWLINIYVAVILGAEEVVAFALISRVAAVLSLPASASTPLIQAGVSANRSPDNCHSVARFSGIIVLATAILQLMCIVILVLTSIFTNYLDSILSSDLWLAFIFYCLTHVFHVLAGLAGIILMMTGEAKRVSRVTISFGFLSLALGIVLSWLYGLAGTLLVCGLISLTQNVCFNIMLYRRDQYLPIQAALSSLRTRRQSSTSFTRS